MNKNNIVGEKPTNFTKSASAQSVDAVVCHLTNGGAVGLTVNENTQNTAAKTRKRQFLSVEAARTYNAGAPKARSNAKAPKQNAVKADAKASKVSAAKTLNANAENASAKSKQSNAKAAQKPKTRVSKRGNSGALSSKVKIGFLGGVGEIGKNMTFIEANNQILVIDSGVMFPSEDMPGIDLVIPDYSYLKDNADKVVGFVITHGHEDHIGSIPYVMRDFPRVPVYASGLTSALISNKLREFKGLNVNLITIKTRELYKIGNFAVEFVDVNHSIGDACALHIVVNGMRIFHSGDFKIDFRPIDGKMIDLPRIAEIGEAGVDLLLCESTNVERAGYTLSESDVGAKLEEIFAGNVGKRLFVATFSSNIYRIQQIIDLAIKFERKVAVVGRSIVNNMDAATRIGKFKFPKNTFIDIEKANGYDDGKVLILCTGSQGEPSAVLARLANGEFPKIDIGTNDTIIFSSSPIPGNEALVNRVVNNLCRKGANVITEDVHASGHACTEELKTLHSLLKPRNFIPVHGEYRHLQKHAKLAESLGLDPKHILICENGNTAILSGGNLTYGDPIKSGEVLIDGFGVGDLSSVVLRDRKQLSEDGIAIVTMVIKRDTHELMARPVILTRGLVYAGEADELNAELQKIVIDALDDILKNPKFDTDEAKNLIRRPVRNYLNKKMGRMPIVLPIFNLV